MRILNKLGRSESDNYAYDLENALEEVLDVSASSLQTSFVTGTGNTVIHSEWDNFDQKISGVHVEASIHMAAGIRLQESIQLEGKSIAQLPTVIKTKDRKRKETNKKEKPPYFLNLKDRAGPKFPEKMLEREKPIQDNLNKEYENACLFTSIWQVCRLINKYNNVCLALVDLSASLVSNQNH